MQEFYIRKEPEKVKKATGWDTFGAVYGVFSLSYFIAFGHYGWDWLVLVSSMCSFWFIINYTKKSS